AYGFRILAGVFREAVGLRLFIRDSQTSACIHVLDRVPIIPQLTNQLCHPLHRCRKRVYRGDLRTDVHADASNLQEETVGSARIEAARFTNRNSKFMLL